ncbi:DUF2147 domain-containing protein [Devosia algicola]|uniref:DUF2147 domain-containing protein n=1 Tax=Devosia algicola TaxID=3026418 RepID=A0ABY7YT43_9HYPH|nr:DUF2147 domain-containing protein [Devosia algicola]WDR04020.1 DUF2147 domain-containing protein [Devosia algicola]
MKRLIIAAMAVMGIAMASLPVTAQTLNPEGRWEIESRDSRYDVKLCGDDGTRLCATLVWLGNGGDSPENRPYLNTMILDTIPLVGSAKWRGTLSLYGHQARGTVTMVGPDQMSLRGCFLGIICRTYQMYRYNG